MDGLRSTVTEEDVFFGEKGRGRKGNVPILIDAEVKACLRGYVMSITILLSDANIDAKGCKGAKQVIF